MNVRYAFLISVPVLSALSCFTYLQLQRSDDTVQRRSAESVERPTATNDVDIIALRGEVASLSAEIFAMRHQIAARAAPVASRAEGPPAPDPRSDADAAAEAETARLAQIEQADAAFRGQAVDQSWSASTTSTIREVLSSTEVGGLKADNIDCRSSSCRVELHDDGTGRLDKSLPLFALQIGASLPTITASNIPRSNGTSDVVLYMSRENGEQPSR